MKTLASMLIAIAMLLAAGSAQAETTLYVGDTKEYAVAFKAEEARLYVIELAGTTNCYYTEPHEDLGPGGFSVFAAPTLMRSDSEGLHAYDFGTRVRAELEGDAVIGDFSYSESELSYHCDTGFEPKPFQASRYEPAGTGAPVSGERPVYYGSEASTEVFLRVINRRAGGIRGTFVPRCRIGRVKKIPARHALFFNGPSAFTELGEDGGFETKAVEDGWARSGAYYKEKISFTGSVTEDAIAGNYLRIRRTKPRGKPVRRCVTGPLPFRAVRYLPMAG